MNPYAQGADAKSQLDQVVSVLTEDFDVHSHAVDMGASCSPSGK